MFDTPEDILRLSLDSPSALVPLLQLEGEHDCRLLYQAADRVREIYCGPEVFLRGIIEFSSFCRRNCHYCGLRKDNIHLPRYRMSEDEIFAAARMIHEQGIETVVLQSGEDPHYTPERLASIVKRILDSFDVAITLSAGEFSPDEYEFLRVAGADRYLLKIETTNPDIYHSIHPDSNLEDRMKCTDWLREAGFQVGSGFMIGLPGQTAGDIAGDIWFLKKIDADMAGIGPFIPHPGTPMGKDPGGSVSATLKATAVSRLVLKDTHLPTTTALESSGSGNRVLGLKAGSNVVMPNFTPLKYRKLYQIYPEKAGSDLEPLEALKVILEQIRGTGRPVGKGKGDSLKKTFRARVHPADDFFRT